uniref:Uncharacterized protein n=1 Tax=Clytia hemisphaerica TaxID=252671 RepID=A0A7M5X2B6_9CNID
MRRSIINLDNIYEDGVDFTIENSIPIFALGNRVPVIQHLNIGSVVKSTLPAYSTLRNGDCGYFRRRRPTLLLGGEAVDSNIDRSEYHQRSVLNNTPDVIDLTSDCEDSLCDKSFVISETTQSARSDVGRFTQSHDFLRSANEQQSQRQPDVWNLPTKPIPSVIDLTSDTESGYDLLSPTNSQNTQRFGKSHRRRKRRNRKPYQRYFQVLANGIPAESPDNEESEKSELSPLPFFPSTSNLANIISMDDKARTESFKESKRAGKRKRDYHESESGDDLLSPTNSQNTQRFGKPHRRQKRRNRKSYQRYFQVLANGIPSESPENEKNDKADLNPLPFFPSTSNLANIISMDDKARAESFKESKRAGKRKRDYNAGYNYDERSVKTPRLN